MSTRPLEVLFVVPSLRMGGAEKHLLRLLRHLDRRRIRASLAAHYLGGELLGLLDPEIPSRALCPGRPKSALLRAVRSIVPLRRQIAASRPALICAIQDLSGVVAARALGGRSKSRPKLVLSVQNLPRARPGMTHGPGRRLLLALARRARRQADGLVAASQGVAAELEALHPTVPIEVIYNAGFDDLPVSDRESTAAESMNGNGVSSRAGSSPLIVSCGRLVPQKAPLDLLDAVARSRRRPRLWMVGDGPLRPAVERRIAELGLTDRVELLGFRDDPRPYVSAADVFVSASLYEGFGNVLVEAMACGVPIVATDCPHGPAEILESGAGGLLVPPGDVGALAEAVDRLLDEPLLARELAGEGRRRAEDFHPAVVARRYTELFERLVPGV